MPDMAGMAEAMGGGMPDMAGMAGAMGGGSGPKVEEVD